MYRFGTARALRAYILKGFFQVGVELCLSRSDAFFWRSICKLHYLILAVAISPLTAIYPWSLFCRNHSRVFILPYLLHLCQ